MSRWPPEIAGTISHPAGRSAVTAERVPIFYSARSSSPSFSSAHRILPFSLSLSSLFRRVHPSLSTPPPMHRGLSVLDRYNVSTRMDRSRFHPKKKDERGGRRWPEARKKADAPTTPTYLRYPLSCPSFSPFSSCFLAPTPFATFFSPVEYFRTGSEWPCGWGVCGLLLHSSQKSEEHPLN